MPYASPDALRAYHRVYNRPRRALLWKRYRAAGACGDCGRPIATKARCFRCRLRAAKAQRLRRAA